MSMEHIHRRKTDNVWTCGKCGWVINDQDKPWKATCPTCAKALSAPSQRSLWRPIMVGDLVEKALTSIGITKPLVEKLTRTETKPGGCGCAGRQKWLNDAGVKAQRKAQAGILAVRRFYLGQ